MPDFNFHVIAGRGDDSVFFIEPDGGNEVLVRALDFLFLFSNADISISHICIMISNLLYFDLNCQINLF